MAARRRKIKYPVDLDLRVSETQVDGVHFVGVMLPSRTKSIYQQTIDSTGTDPEHLFDEWDSHGRFHYYSDNFTRSMDAVDEGLARLAERYKDETVR
jgi:hypothetical protein